MAWELNRNVSGKPCLVVHVPVEGNPRGSCVPTRIWGSCRVYTCLGVEVGRALALGVLNSSFVVSPLCGLRTKLKCVWLSVKRSHA